MKNLLCIIFFLGALSLLPVSAQDAVLAVEGQTEQAENLALPRSDIINRAYLPDDTRNVIAGDVLRMQIFEDEEPAILVGVNEQGYADFPYIGRRHVAGVTCKAIADKLKELLEQTYYYQATVFIAIEKQNPVRGRVYIVGEVGSKGPLGLPSDTEFTISKAILAAGGFTPYAKESKVRIIRDLPDGTQKTFVVDVEHIYETGDRSDDLLLKPDDYIIVPKSSINF